ncbi:MAG: hypothetical protein WBQ60_06475 [Asticcacaulis sp.]
MKITRSIAVVSVGVGVIAVAGGLLYAQGGIIPKIFHNNSHYNHGIMIADNVTRYSPAQLQQLSREVPVRYDYAAGKSYVPPSVNYIRVEYLASHETKSFPKIFIADKAFPYNPWIMESVWVVTSIRMRKILRYADDLNCSSDSGDLRAGMNRVEVLLREGDQHLRRCLISRKAGCKYLHSLYKIPPTDLVDDSSSPKSELEVLKNGMGCAAIHSWF